MQTGAELLAFMSRRIKSQAGLWAELGHCHGLGETVEAQRKFVAGLTKDYTDEAAHLTEIARRNIETVTHVLAHPAGQAAGNADRPRGGAG